MNILRTVLIAFAAIAATAGCLIGPAFAATPHSHLAHTDGAQIVRYGDLDLQTAAGQATLNHRVAVAARHACGPVEMLGSPDAASYDACVAQAVRDAGERVAMRTGIRYAAN